ncbi:MAG: hypothetical protein K2X87_24945 [Gemmataceae bacterium]|nr:hypothetical protein [Gemmataceae bacterium]
MNRKRVGIAVGLVVLAAVVVYFVRRDRDPVVEPDPHPLGGGGTELAITAVEYHGSAGRRVVKPERNGFSVPPSTKGAVVITGTHPAGAGAVSARLVEFDPIDRTESPVADLPVGTTAATGFRVEVPADRLQRGHVYRIALADPASGKTAVYQFNVSNVDVSAPQ